MSASEITPVEGQPLNRLMIAINHYISTGTHVGEGIALPEGGCLLVVLPVNQSDPRDAEDFRRFRARFDEIGPGLGLKLGYAGVENAMEMWTLRLRREQMEPLTTALRAEPGPLGWGSLYPILAEHGLTEPRT